MKKILLLLALAIIGQIAIAQDMKRQDANNYQRQAQQLIEAAEDYKAVNKMDKAAKQMSNAKILMQKAKASIDAAAVHESTANQAKTWHYYAVIYYRIGAYPEFYDLDTEAFPKVLTAVEKIREIDPKYYQQMGQELASYVRAIDNTYYQLGVESFNNGDFEDAMLNFQKANNAASKIGSVDDAAMSNIAICAIRLEKYDVAAETYETLVSKGFDNIANYSGLINSYRELGQGDKAVETINAAIAKYPDEPQLINEMIQTYLTLHREGEIVDQIEAMAQKFTDQPVYYVILGTIYGNRESQLYDIDKAIGYYEKAIAEDDKYADAYYNAGALLIDKASEIYQEVNDKDPGEYSNFNAYLAATDEMSAQAKVYDERALPYVEKTYELLPDDPAVKQALKGIYTRLKMADKAKELD